MECFKLPCGESNCNCLALIVIQGHTWISNTLWQCSLMWPCSQQMSFSLSIRSLFSSWVPTHISAWDLIQPAALVMACGGYPASPRKTAHATSFSVGAASLRWLLYWQFEFIKMKSNYKASSSVALVTCQVLGERMQTGSIPAHRDLWYSSG